LEGESRKADGELDGDAILVEPILEGGQLASFILTLPLKEAVLSPLELTVE
jgi:hypothetical protein